jgi:hypothetical protein
MKAVTALREFPNKESLENFEERNYVLLGTYGRIYLERRLLPKAAHFSYKEYGSQS